MATELTIGKLAESAGLNTEIDIRGGMRLYRNAGTGGADCPIIDAQANRKKDAPFSQLA